MSLQEIRSTMTVMQLHDHDQDMTKPVCVECAAAVWPRPDQDELERAKKVPHSSPSSQSPAMTDRIRRLEFDLRRIVRASASQEMDTFEFDALSYSSDTLIQITLEIFVKV
jgi:hypothetical protein